MATFQNPKFSSQQPNCTEVTDEWLDRLALDGYNIKEILASIFIRYRQDSVTFGKYLSRRAASLKNAKYKVKNFLPRLPITMQINEIIPLLMDKYRISADGAKLLLQDYLWIYQQENQVFTQLSKRGMTILKHQQGRTNTVIFFCNEQMKNNYQKFGDFVCVDFKPINIKKKSKKGYMVGVFSGQDTNLHHTLFGVSLVMEDKYQNYHIAIKQFLKGMKLRKYPQSFIVGSSHLLYKAISDLSIKQESMGLQSFGCLMGWHNLVDKIAKIYKNHSMRDQIIQKFGNVLSTLNKQQLEIKIKDLLSLLPKDEVMKKFISEHSCYFVANNEPSFIGFGIERDHINLLYKIMYNFLRECENIGFFLQQTIKMEEMLLSRINKGYQIIAQAQLTGMGIKITDQIKYLSIRLERKLFKKFLIMYRTAIKHAKIIAISTDELCYQIVFKAQKKTTYKTYVYTVKYSLQESCWNCNCGFIYQSGIPCAHLIKMIRKFRGSMSYYINKRWMIQNSKFNPEMINHPSELNMQPEKEDSQQPLAEETQKSKQKGSLQDSLEPNIGILDENENKNGLHAEQLDGNQDEGQKQLNVPGNGKKESYNYNLLYDQNSIHQGIEQVYSNMNRNVGKFHEFNGKMGNKTKFQQIYQNEDVRKQVEQSWRSDFPKTTEDQKKIKIEYQQDDGNFQFIEQQKESSKNEKDMEFIYNLDYQQGGTFEKRASESPNKRLYQNQEQHYQNLLQLSHKPKKGDSKKEYFYQDVEQYINDGKAHSKKEKEQPMKANALDPFQDRNEGKQQQRQEEVRIQKKVKIEEHRNEDEEKPKAGWRQSLQQFLKQKYHS